MSEMSTDPVASPDLFPTNEFVAYGPQTNVHELDRMRLRRREEEKAPRRSSQYKKQRHLDAEEGFRLRQIDQQMRTISRKFVSRLVEAYSAFLEEVVVFMIFCNIEIDCIFSPKDALEDLDTCVKQASLYEKGTIYQRLAANKFIATAKGIAEEIKTYAASINFNLETNEEVVVPE